MKKLKLKPNLKDHHWTFTEDIFRIVKIFEDHGYQITESDAVQSWERHSDLFFAGWLVLPENDQEIYYHLIKYFEETE